MYIRNQRDGAEELYNEQEDSAEMHDLSRVDAMRLVLERLRGRLNKLR